MAKIVAFKNSAHTVMENSKNQDSIQQDEEAAQLKKHVTELILGMFSDQVGMEVYALMKTNDHPLRRIRFDETTNTHSAILYSVKEQLRSNYIDSELGNQETVHVYQPAINISNESGILYVIPQSNNYYPFIILNDEYSNDDLFNIKDMDKVKGFLFRFARDQRYLWAYRQKYSIMNLNMKSGISIFQEGPVFRQFKNELVTIGNRIDLIIFPDTNEIVTDNIKLLQTKFGFEQFIRKKAEETIKKIREMDIVEDIDNLENLVGNKDIKHARRIMRANNARTLLMPADQLIQKVKLSRHWNDVFKFSEDGSKFQIKTQKEWKDFVDMLNDRFLISDITEDEYDVGDANKKYTGN